MFSKAYTFILAITSAGCAGAVTTLEQSAQTWEQSRGQIVQQLNYGRSKNPLQQLDKLYPQNQDNADFLNVYGLALISNQQTDKAIKILRKAHQLAPNMTTSLNLSSALLETGKHRHAMNVLLKARKQGDYAAYDHKERFFHNLALSLERQGKVEKASKIYKKALKNNDEFYLSHLQLGTIEHKRGHHKAALSHLDKASQLCPFCPEPLLEGADILLRLQMRDRARQMLLHFAERPGLPEDAQRRALEKAKQL